MKKLEFGYLLGAFGGCFAVFFALIMVKEDFSVYYTPYALFFACLIVLTLIVNQVSEIDEED